MELYDKRYVYFDWDDRLNDKNVFVADSIDWIKSKVNECRTDLTVEIKKSKNPSEPFELKHSNNTFVFAYYDPFYEKKTCNPKVHAKDYIDYSNYQPTEPRYYLSINKNNSYLEFTISQNITNNTIYIGTRKECERMTKIFCNEFGDCGSCGGEGTSCSCCGKLRHIISKYSHEKYKRRMTNRELSEYLAKGNGEFKNVGYLINTSASYFYQDGAENKNVDNNIFIRDFGSDEWREPLIEV